MFSFKKYYTLVNKSLFSIIFTIINFIEKNKLNKHINAKNLLYLTDFCIFKLRYLYSSNKALFYLALFVMGLLNFFSSQPFSFVIITHLTFSFILLLLLSFKENIWSQISIFSIFLFGYYFAIMSWMMYPIFMDSENVKWIFLFPIAILIILLPYFSLYSLNLVIIKRYRKNHFAYEFLLCFALFVSLFCGDLIRSNLYFQSGFPWMQFGHLYSFDILIQILPYIGFEFYSAFVIFSFFWPYLLIMKLKSEDMKNRKILNNIIHFFIFFTLIIVIYGIGNVLFTTYNSKMKENRNYKIIAPQMNFKSKRAVSISEMNVKLHQTLSEVLWTNKIRTPILLVFPESTMLTFENSLQTNDFNENMQNLSSLLFHEDSLLISGGTMLKDNGNYYNIALAIAKNIGITDIYKKEILVPFGEYMPWQKFLPKKFQSLATVNTFLRAEADNSKFIYYKKMPLIIPLICYEAIFSKLIKNRISQAKKLLQMESGSNGLNEDLKKDLLIINLTNDAWFGNTLEPYQHLAMVKMNAVLNKINILRVSNNGTSALISKYGKLQGKTKLNKKQMLVIDN